MEVGDVNEIFLYRIDDVRNPKTCVYDCGCINIMSCAYKTIILRTQNPPNPGDLLYLGNGAAQIIPTHTAEVLSGYDLHRSV